MYLIYKHVNPSSVILFNSLDDIKESIKTEVYGKYNHDKTRISGSENNYLDFKLISNPTFPYILCDNYCKYIKNDILNIYENQKSEYYLLEEHQHAHGVWDFTSVDCKKIIFDDLESMKKYYKSVKEKLQYIYRDYYNDVDDDISDDKLIDKKFNELLNYKEKVNSHDSNYYEIFLNYLKKFIPMIIQILLWKNLNS